ncbi:MAG: glutamate--tRNA ligase [Bacteroidales bacterium]|nr:glutamate--tRNA ligase [Bacteroidales bacterium]
MSNQAVRVRFAPSPTGPLHIGGVRTALFNYLFARKNKGTFILRIEDTDQTRYVQGAEQYTIDSLDWCGIRIDEGITADGPHSPYRQSERKELYRKYAEILADKGFAYLAFDTPEELNRLRKNAESRKGAFTYNAFVRKKLKNSLTLNKENVKRNVEAGVPYVIRYRMPEDHWVEFQDTVRGDVEVNTRTLDDKILLKADGMPTYHLANVVDDHLMKISHVIRGEEWLPSTPLHILLYEAFGWQDSMPAFAHMPLTLKPDGQGKLSKRDGDRLGFPVFPLEWIQPDTGEKSSGYRESGYFPEAFINILALLGWNPGTEQEIFTMDELIQAFSLDRIVKAGSRFDPEKAKWFNHQYLVKKSGDELSAWFTGELEQRDLEFEMPYISKALDLVKERAFLLTELWDQSWFFFQSPVIYDEKVVRKVWKDDTHALLHDLHGSLGSVEPFTAGKIEPVVKNLAESRETGFGRLMNPLRLALVGSNIGPGLMDMMEVLGKEEVLQRIARALQLIK